MDVAIVSGGKIEAFHFICTCWEVNVIWRGCCEFSGELKVDLRRLFKNNNNEQLIIKPYIFSWTYIIRFHGFIQPVLGQINKEINDARRVYRS